MKYTFTKQRKVAIGLMLIYSVNLFAPTVSYALTSGPSQPETKGFQPAGVADMVDLETGDFKYNIPLLDIDGYPINLNYASGTGMDDEASWVGVGWSLNPGAVNRQVRGVPDDMEGDLVTTDHYTKPKITVGGRLKAKVEIGGRNNLAKDLGLFSIKGEGSFSLGVFSDNYTGIGAEVGVNPGITMSSGADGAFTAGLGLGINSNTSSGVDFTPNINLSVKGNTDHNITTSAGLSASLGYNSRSGMKDLSLSSSFGMSYVKGVQPENNNTLYGSSISYNTEPIQAKIQVPYVSNYGSFSIDVGGVGGIVFIGGGGTGYKSVNEVQSLSNSNPSYGFLYAEKGKNQKNAIMDFIREKDNPVIPELPNLAIPVHTPDIFSFSSQAGSGQFRLYRGGSGAFFDNEVTNTSNSNTIGLDLGFGGYFHGGVTLFQQKTTNTTSKWTDKNYYLPYGDFQDPTYHGVTAQHAYFKQVGEKTVEDTDMVRKLYGTQPLSVLISGANAIPSFSTHPLSALKKNARQYNSTDIAYLTAFEASQYALEKKIFTYPLVDKGNFHPAPSPAPADSVYRTADYRKGHHISEISVTDNQGKRMVYGIPVYNIKQDEYSFAVGGNYSMVPGKQDQVQLSHGETESTLSHNSNGIDHYYHKDSHPAYASSFLLTAVLSPDYVDKTGNGISDDDLGTAIKFNYSKLATTFKWRTPYQNATLNKCMLADKDDDKASIVYGEKEIYYVHSIESKTKIAYFITKDRHDGFGVTGFNGLPDTSNHQRCLDEIRLYSKADMSQPIKTVKFEYDYSLCPGVPNSTHNGKLTLKKVYFLYGNTSKGKYHPYLFTYNTAVGDSTNVGYSTMSTDRWGTYKMPGVNAPFNLHNDEFPYTQQDLSGTNTGIKTIAGQEASLWHLKHIDLPTGGGIEVSYESDDYAYVQNRKAMVMTPVAKLIDYTGADISNDLSPTILKDAAGFKINISPTADQPDATAWFKKTYLNGSNFIYSKFRVKMSTDNSQSGGQDYDFVPCYAEIAHVSIASNVARIWLKGRTEDGVYANPILFAAWQRMKDEYPRYAYSGFDRRADDGNANQSLSSAVQAIFSAFSNLSELTEKFYSKARRNSYACQLDTLNKSFVRIAKIDGHKLGGGARVSKVRISDDWQDMTGANDRFYGQAYDYTTTEGGQTVSSGVASYEPTVGNDENPFRMPVPYVQHIKGGLDEFFDLEEPFGESFFPSPSVVYSKVTVTDLDKDGNPDSDIRTGYIVNEFYTAKDFPVKVTVLPMQKFESKSNTKYTLTETSATDELCLSQGYAIELNDMHGKAKATRVFNHSRSEISSTVYYYNTTPDGTGQKLSNVVKIVNPDGTISSNKVIGRDVEFFTDFRQQETRNDGNTINIGGDIIPAFFIPLPIPHWPTGNNTEFKRFRSACGVKLSQYYGIVDRVVKTQNGSSITTQNIAYDGLTGEALVTRTQNEFKKDIYSVNMPAYWVYPRMGGAYHDSGMMLSDFRTDFHGALYNYDYYLQPGDVLADLAGSALYWVIETPYPPNPSIKTKKLVDVHGKLKKSFTPSMIKIVRSAFKNMLGASTSSVVCLNNPITYDASLNKEVLQLRNNSDLTALKVINASANTFDEAWSATPPCHPYLDPLLTNTSHCFNFCAPSTSSVYNESGTRILSNPWNSYTGNNELTGALWGESDNATQSVDDPLVNGATTQDFSLNSPNTGICTSRDDESCSTSYNYGSTPSHANWPLVRSGIWSCTPVSNNLNEVIGFDTCVNNATQVAKTYFFGFAADNYIEIYIDGGRVFSSSNYMYWTITPYQLLPGKHAVHVEFYNKCVDGADNSNNPAIVGLEIYDNTITQLKNAQNLSDLNVIFSTQGLRGASVQSFRTISGQKVYHYTNADYSIPGVCDKVTARVNPYIEGYLGNWRPYQTKVFQQGRSYNNIFNPAMKGIDVKNAGYIQNFSPHWYYSNTQAKWLKSNAPRWVTANTVTLYDKYGQQLENKDALGRYSAAKFDFYGELPSAVASNAMNREIYAGSFEDNKFRPGSANADTCNSSGEFYNTSGVSIRHLIDSTQSHSGNYCAVIPSGDGVVLNTLVHNVQQKTLNYLTFNDQYEYYAATSMGIVPKGFEPNPGKKYIFNTWIKDDQPTDKSYVGIDLVINNSIHPALTCKAIVEGWKLIEGTIDLRAVSSGTNLSIAIKSTSDLNVLIDDIRMHPVDSHMKTYAYDDKTMRLMAEIDENGFATFYEYDSEGLLIRVKKETERGVMTLKESRSSYKKRLP